jgi:DNA-directed RNA polymerase specialized sigma24 family protein
MSYVEGLKIKEIADALSLSESTVEKRKAKALDLIRERLIEVYGDSIFVTMLMIELWSQLK